jgi:beta-phosphoglucomutase family hydrolase
MRLRELSGSEDFFNFYTIPHKNLAGLLSGFFLNEKATDSQIYLICIKNLIIVNTNLSFKAVVFDMDGVITKTALTHAHAWKKMFDEYLRKREIEHSEPFVEFTHANDYLPYVDGKPRYKGVQSFLESRGIHIPFGEPADKPGTETVCGLGNQKNIAFNEVLEKGGVEVYPSTVALLYELKAAGIKLGVASSSKNCKPVLERVNLLDIFDARVDGVVSAELGLHGKPEPDIFTTACDIFDVKYVDAIVVEDAVSGVQAGKKGNFGLTLGIARENNRRELEENGADLVVEDLEEIGGIEGLNEIYRIFKI